MSGFYRFLQHRPSHVLIPRPSIILRTGRVLSYEGTTETGGLVYVHARSGTRVTVLTTSDRLTITLEYAIGGRPKSIDWPLIRSLAEAFGLPDLQLGVVLPDSDAPGAITLTEIR